MLKVAINGIGRIGSAVLDILLSDQEFEVVALNDLAASSDLAYILKYDSVYGPSERTILDKGDHLEIDGKGIALFHEKDPAALPWSRLGIDLVFECTGRFTKREELEKHLQAGAKRVALSAPPKSSDVPIVVPGVNTLDREAKIFSVASCTTNCIAPVMEILDRTIGVKKAIMTTVHAYTNGQELVDTLDKDRRRGRAAAINFIPTSTGAAVATSKVLPQLTGKFDGASIRGPVPCGSISDINVVTKRPTTVEEVNKVLEEEAKSERYQQILGTTKEALVSSDILGDSRPSIVDLSMTQVVDGDLVKVMSWYDNEWGYANQMVRLARKLLK